ncbi:MAG: cupredoxin domain-containing protein [Acidimicrobiales bacterium]
MFWSRSGSPLLVAAVVAVMAACTSTSGGAATGIVATDSACKVATADLGAGKHTFLVTNDGDKVTEVYVYAPGDRVVAEKENIGPGTTTRFTADLAAGRYEIACKPGQTGNGIRQVLTVTGAGGAPVRPADREVALQAADYSYTGLENLSVRPGETIEFDMVNRGTMDHEFEVIGPDGTTSGEIGPTKAGAAGKATLTFATPGTYRFRCGIDDHEARGMSGTFVVA